MSTQNQLQKMQLYPSLPSASAAAVAAAAAAAGYDPSSGVGVGVDTSATTDVEENWLAHVDKVTNEPSNKGLLSTFGAFSKLFEELKASASYLL